MCDTGVVATTSTSSTSRPGRLLALIATMAALVASCGGEDSEVATLDPSVLQGAATTIGGETFDLGSLEDTDVVIWFWAPW